eukprot:219183_1
MATKLSKIQCKTESSRADRKIIAVIVQKKKNSKETIKPKDISIESKKNNTNNITEKEEKIDAEKTQKNDPNTIKVNGKLRHLYSNSGYIDEHGFYLSFEEKQIKIKEIGSEMHRNQIKSQQANTTKWLKILDNWTIYNTTKKSSLKSHIPKGIPSALRGKVWKRILGINKLSHDKIIFYKNICSKEPPAKVKSVIDRDLTRTFHKHILFNKEKENEFHHSGIHSLRNILYGYANFDRAVGYTQGMGYIAAIFLMLMTEEFAFYALCAMLDENGNYNMRGLYLDGLPLLNLRCFQFDRLLSTVAPKIYKHLNSFNITPEFYASQWFLTVFCCDFPFKFVYRIWDIYLFEGIEFVFRISLALVKLNQEKLLKITKFDNMIKYLQSIHQYITDIDKLLKCALDLNLKSDHLQIIEWNVSNSHIIRKPRTGMK